MGKKITAHLFLMGLFAAVAAAIITSVVFANSFQKQVEFDLRSSGDLIADAYGTLDNLDDLQAFADNLRITLIDTDGTVLFESAADKTTMDNHASRPEVEQAVQTGTGESMRRSDTKDSDEYYYAVRLDDGRVLRVSLEAKSAFDTFRDAYPAVIILILLLLVMSVLFAVVLTKKLVRPINRLADSIDSETIRDEDKIYPELAPFIEEIQFQRRHNLDQLKELSEQQEKLTAIIKSMSEGLIILDKEHKIMMMNESARTYLGCVGDPEHKNIVFATRNRDILSCIERAADGDSHTETIRVDGRNLQVMASPVLTDQMPMGVICFILDVTEKVQIEKMKQEFTANVSHELKTPLTSISGYAELIETGIAKQEDISAFAAKIHKEAGRMLTLISDIIRLSELDEIQTISDAEEVDLLEVAKECVSSLTLLAKHHFVTLKIEGKHACVTGNRSMLTELVYNLCDNAIRYNKKGGTVTITVADRQITVADTGIGIPTKYQHRIFERFYRVDKSRSKETGGTGLGLAIAKHIAKQHGAEITLTSTEGIGTKITVIF